MNTLVPSLTRDVRVLPAPSQPLCKTKPGGEEIAAAASYSLRLVIQR